jgi:hypothetical protein
MPGPSYKGGYKEYHVLRPTLGKKCETLSEKINKGKKSCGGFAQAGENWPTTRP